MEIELFVVNNIAICHRGLVLLFRPRGDEYWSFPTLDLLDNNSDIKGSIVPFVKDRIGFNVEVEKPIHISEYVKDGKKHLGVYWQLRMAESDAEIITNFIKSYTEYGWFEREMVSEIKVDPKIDRNLWDRLWEHFGDNTQKLRESLAKVEKQNSELKSTKEAMRILLDDSRNLEEELKEERDRIHLIISSMGEGLLVIDKQKKVIMINPVAERLLELGAEDILNNKWSDTVITLKEGSETPTNERSFSLALKTKRVIVTRLEDDHFYKTKTGKIFPVASITAPLISDGELIGAVKVFRNVTKEKEIDKMKTEFISLASHQLRTPLSAMKWFLEMLLNGDAGELTAEQKEYVINIDESNERMISLVNSLLNISRIESGRIIIDPVMTNLASLVQSVIDELKPKFKNKDQEPIVSIHGNLPKINIDPKLIRNVYMNLLTNASKYTPVGGSITVFISKKKKMIVSQVSDSGYGIPENSKSRVFEKFYRASNVVKKETEGSGLGLYLAKIIVESSGGEIWFDSNEGEGTSFWFSLPLAGTNKKQGDVALDT